METANDIEQKLIESDRIIKFKARQFASRTYSTVLDYYDFLQEAKLSCILACQKYDPAKGPWEPYLNQTINNNLSVLVASSGAVVSVPTYVSSQSVKIYNMEAQKLEREEILSRLNISNSEYLELRPVFNRESIPDNLPTKSSDLPSMQEILDGLSKEDQEIINLYLDGNKLKSIASQLNLSYNLVRERFANIIKQLKNKYNVKEN